MDRKLLGGNEEEGSRLSSRVPTEKTRGNNRHYLQHLILHLHVRKQLFAVGRLKYWHRLPREVVESPSLELFKT